MTPEQREDYSERMENTKGNSGLYGGNSKSQQQSRASAGAQVSQENTQSHQPFNYSPYALSVILLLLLGIFVMLAMLFRKDHKNNH